MMSYLDLAKQAETRLRAKREQPTYERNEANEESPIRSTRSTAPPLAAQEVGPGTRTDPVLPSVLALDPVTVRDVLGPAPEPEAVAAICRDVAAALAAIEAGIATGALPPRQIVRGRPLVDWVPMDEVARLLLRAWHGPAGAP